MDFSYMKNFEKSQNKSGWEDMVNSQLDGQEAGGEMRGGQQGSHGQSRQADTPGPINQCLDLRNNIERFYMFQSEICIKTSIESTESVNLFCCLISNSISA